MTADTVGGVWNYALALCRALRPLDVEVHLATMGAPLSAAQRADVGACTSVTLHESTFRLEWMSDPWRDVVEAGRWLLRLERQVQPDVVHLNSYAHGFMPWQAPAVVVGHSCVLSWWRAVHGCDAPAGWKQYATAVSAGLQAAHAVVAPTHAMLDALIAHYGPLPQSRVIRNGVDADPLPFGVRDAFGRYPGSRALPQPLVLAAGRIWDESKNLATLAAAAPHIRWPVYVAGADTDPEGRRVTLPNVHLLGTLAPAALRRWYRDASVFVQPSLYEPFGLAPLEAALYRCALVLADIPSLCELWHDAALFVPSRDPAALADAVNGITRNPLLGLQLADAARLRAQEYSAAHMAREYYRLYQEMRGTRSHEEAVACAS